MSARIHIIRCLIALAIACASIGSAAADSYALIICGSGGDPEFTERFEDWGKRLYNLLTGDLGFAADKVSLLTESDAATKGQSGGSTLDGVRSAMDMLATRVTPEDDFFMFIIGHGSFMQGISKINVPGPDISAEDIKGWLDNLDARRTVVINSASASAGFINVLGAPNRIICSATKSVEEKNATVFMEHFIEALEDGSADLNRDTRISVWEACEQAALLTRTWYESEGLISTEHALIDDTGDGLGTRLAADIPLNPEVEPDAHLGNNPPDGALAQRCFLRDFQFPESVPQTLIDTYLANLDKVEELKLQKLSMEPDVYYRELETLLIAAARANAEIHQIIDTTPNP